MNVMFKEDDHEDEELTYESLLNDPNGLRDEEQLIMDANMELGMGPRNIIFSKKNKILSKCMRDITLALETYQVGKVLY